MTVLSTKKPSTNNRESASNQPIQQQTSGTARVHVSCDDEKSNGTDSNANSTDTNLPTTSATTDNLNSPVATTPPIFFNKPKRKSHKHQHRHSSHQTINKQARRKCTSIEENLSTDNSLSDDNLTENVSSSITTSDNQIFDENEQYNSEDEYEEKPKKYDRNNQTEVCYAYFVL